MNLSRRELIQLAAAGIGAAVGADVPASGKQIPSRPFEHGQALEEFSYGQVQFGSGLHETQLQQTLSVVLNMDEDGLLHSFRRYAGLPTPGCPLTGHYEALNAESFGCFVSALARFNAIQESDAARAKAERLVVGLAPTIEPTGKIFPKTTGVKANAVSFPKYSRIVRAMIDAHQFAGVKSAFETLARATDAILPKLNGEVGRDSTAGWNLLLPESEFLAWQITGDPRHLDIATRYLYRDFFDRLARGENCLGGRNALAHVNALASAAKAYLVLGDTSYLEAARNGFAFIEAQSYATGGWGPNECFIPQSLAWGEPIPAFDRWMPPIETLGQSLTRTHWHFQTPTAADAHLTLARYLLRITKDSKYGDSMERVMYNTVLGALPLQANGMAFCNADYHSDAHKTYFDNYGFGNTGPEWPLEAGVLPLVTTDYRLNTYYRDEAGIYVNWFVPSTLKWQQSGSTISLTQSGSYPLGDEIAFTLSMPQPCRFNVRLRIPAWAHQASIRINGRPASVPVKSGEFASLKREWRQGDRIELRIPRHLTLKAVDAEHPHLVALVYEPLVLFAVTPLAPELTREQLLSARREKENGHEWRVQVGNESIPFVPFWAISYERYSTYFSVSV